MITRKGNHSHSVCNNKHRNCFSFKIRKQCLYNSNVCSNISSNNKCFNSTLNLSNTRSSYHSNMCNNKCLNSQHSSNNSTNVFSKSNITCINHNSSSNNKHGSQASASHLLLLLPVHPLLSLHLALKCKTHP